MILGDIDTVETFRYHRRRSEKNLEKTGCTMRVEELKKYDGKEGRRAYIAYKGKVYDVSESPLWKEGEHENMHEAGTDLTEALANAPHGDEVLKKFSIVGELEKSEEQSKPSEEKGLSSVRKERWRELYKIYHPHPITVHFPIALHIFAAFFDLLFIFSANAVFEQIVFYSFSIATVMGGVAMVFGILSWWLNYNFSKASYFTIKLYVSILTLILGIIGIGIYTLDTQALYSFSVTGILYHLFVFATAVTVIVLGYYGGKITWGEIKHESKPKSSGTKSPRSSKPKIEIPNSASILNLPTKLSKDITNEGVEKNSTKDITILIGGAAGTGINTIEKLLNMTLQAKGIYHFVTREYMSRVRGGANTTLIRMSDAKTSAPTWDVNIFFALDKDAFPHAKERLENALVLADDSLEIEHKNLQKISLKKSVEDIGKIYANTFAFGYICGILEIDLKDAKRSVATLFAGKNEKENLEALTRGYKAVDSSSDYGIQAMCGKMQKDEGYMSGTDAVGFGFLGGGVNFVSSYPMSPSTGVLSFMANISKEHPMVVEQAEDEIAAFNMVQGAWYAGGRGLTTTSGGGFALMCEGLSLSGMTETPALVYLAQRPGPATGLPTRTEQGDLNLALYAGHGEFPRILLAPGDNEEAVLLGYLAAEVADYYQVPVVLLSDQYFADSIKIVKKIDFEDLQSHNFIVKSEEEYHRYAESEHGISPRSIPMYGDGLVCCDSDEHDERGQITEDYKVRESALQKRAKKAHYIQENAIAPKIYGEGEILIIGWGSTKEAIKEVVSQLEDVAFMHFSWIYPLNPIHLESIKGYKKVIAIENNSNAQFSALLKRYGVRVDREILCANGFPFFIDKLQNEIQNTIKEVA